MAALEGVLNIFEEAGLERIREKSLTQTAYLMYLIEEKLHRYGYQIGSPRQADQRGGHVALEHDEAYRICQALKARRVIPDFREPNVIRLAPAPLYVTYYNIYELVEILELISAEKEYEKYESTRALVV